MPVTLPPAVQRMLEQQGVGAYNPVQMQSSSAATMQALQNAIGRRFGQSGEFDQEYNSGIRGLMGQVPNLEANFQNNRNRMEEDFSQGADRLNRQNDTNVEQHTNAMADRGMGFSGANLVGQGRVAEGFQRGVQGIVTNRSRGMADLSNNQSAAYRALQSRAGEMEGAAANRGAVRDQQIAWQQEQQRQAEAAAQAQQQFAQQQLQMQQQAAQQAAQAQAQMQAQMNAASQPVASPTGTYQQPGPPVEDPMTKWIREHQNELGGGYY